MIYCYMGPSFVAELLRKSRDHTPTLPRTHPFFSDQFCTAFVHSLKFDFWDWMVQSQVTPLHFVMMR